MSKPQSAIKGMDNDRDRKSYSLFIPLMAVRGEIGDLMIPDRTLQTKIIYVGAISESRLRLCRHAWTLVFESGIAMDIALRWSAGMTGWVSTDMEIAIALPVQSFDLLRSESRIVWGFCCRE